MNQPQLFDPIANDVTHQNKAGPAAHGANEIRSLDEYEMALTAGGDGIVVWLNP